MTVALERYLCKAVVLWFWATLALTALVDYVIHTAAKKPGGEDDNE